MNYSFPHPVLGYSNEIKGEFIPEIERNLDSDFLKIEVINFNIDNEYFNKLIFERKIANIFLKVQCKSTLKCWSFKLDIEQKNIKIKINVRDIRHYVDIKFLIIANEDFKEYYDEKTFDKDYIDSIAYPENGDIIGITSITKIYLFDDFKSDNSAPIFEYRANDEISHFEYEDNGDNITIIHPKRFDKDRLYDLSYSNFIFSVLYPSLLKCLTDIANLPNDIKQQKSEESFWFIEFEEVVGVNKLSKENVTELTWKYLNSCFYENKFIWKESINELNKINEA